MTNDELARAQNQLTPQGEIAQLRADKAALAEQAADHFRRRLEAEEKLAAAQEEAWNWRTRANRAEHELEETQQREETAQERARELEHRRIECQACGETATTTPYAEAVERAEAAEAKLAKVREALSSCRENAVREVSEGDCYVAVVRIRALLGDGA